MPASRFPSDQRRPPYGRGHPALAGFLLLLAIIMAVGLWTTPALAAHTPDEDKPKSTQVNISASQAARVARRQYGGKVLAVILDADTKAPYYRVKLLSAGRVRVVHVTATNRPQK